MYQSEADQIERLRGEYSHNAGGKKDFVIAIKKTRFFCPSCPMNMDLPAEAECCHTRLSRRCSRLEHHTERDIKEWDAVKMGKQFR